MSDLRELYQELILDHGKNPRNFRVGSDEAAHAKGHNPLCGDKIDLYVTVDDAGKIADVCFQGSGCAISTSSSSLMTQTIKGKTRAEAEALFERFHELITGTNDRDEEQGIEELGKLAVFAGVREYPARAKCATLAWHTMIAALDLSAANGENDKGGAVSTE